MSLKLKDLGVEVNKWSIHNFGDQAANRPLAGVCEELLYELSILPETIMNEDPAKAMDCFADALLFALDWAVRGHFFRDVLDRYENHEYYNQYVLGVHEFSGLHGPTEILGKANQIQLKHDQKIKKWKTLEAYHNDAADIWMCLFFWMDGTCQALFQRTVLSIASDVWEAEVSKRNWTENAEHGNAPSVIDTITAA